MSYNLMICRKNVPKKDDEAWKYIENLSRVSVNEKRELPKDMEKLYNSLTVKYPCICTLSDDKVDDGIWSDGPLHDNFTENYVCIGLVYSRVQEALPFIKKTAKKHGFVVFDPQEGKIFRA